MRHISYIIFISMIFLTLGIFLGVYWAEALPVAFIGGCMGWALTEFKRETQSDI